MPKITREMLDFVGKARSVMEKNLSIVFYSEHIRYVPGSLVALRWGPEQTSILVVVAGDDAGTVFEGIVPPVVIAPRAPDQTVLLKKNPVQVTGYAYSKFDNGVSIFRFQRRLYRKLTENGFKFEDPFSTAQNSFYDLLRKNKLLIMDRCGGGEMRKRDFSDPAGKLRILRKGMLLLKRVIGIKYYNLLMRTLLVLCRPEEQTFLFENLKLDIPSRFRE